MTPSSRPDRARQQLGSAVFIALGILVSAIGVWWIARAIDLDRFLSTFQAVDARWLLAAVGAIVATFFTRTWRWAILLRPLMFRTSALMTALLTGQLLNFVLPLRLGDVARAALLSRAPGSSFARVLGSIVIEKAWDWLTLCVIVIISAPLLVSVPLPAWFILPARTVGLMAAVVLIAFVVAAVLPDVRLRRALVHLERRLALLPPRWRMFLAENGLRFVSSVIALRRRESVIGAASTSLATWSLGIIANYAVLRAYGVDSWSAAMLLVVVLMVGVALPPSIAAIGLFEGLTILTLSAFNLSIELALAIGIALHLVIFVPPLIALGGLLVWNALRGPTFSPVQRESGGEG